MRHLPTHPSRRHPRTGKPLRAVGFSRRGPIWPILGASPDDPPKDDPPKKDPPADDPPKDDPPKKDPPKEDDLGFPADTAVKEMTAEEQAAYWRHQSRKHEGRNTELLGITSGRTGDDLKGDLDELAKLREAKLTDGEKAVEEAKTTTRADTAKEFGTDGARAALEIALGHDEENNDQSAVIDTLDLTKLLKDDGKVDTAKVRAVAEKFAPTVKGGDSTRPDYGGGRRGGKATSGVAAGAARYAEIHGKPDKDS